MAAQAGGTGPAQEGPGRQPGNPDRRGGLSEERAPSQSDGRLDRKSTRLNSSHLGTSYAVFCLKKKDTIMNSTTQIAFGVINPGFVGPGTYTDTSTVKAYVNYVDSLGQMWSVVFFFNETVTTDISTLTLHDALRI